MDFEKISAKIYKSTMNLKIIYKIVRFYLTIKDKIIILNVDETTNQMREANKMNENLIFVGLGQYAKSIQVFFAAIGIFKESLIGGWFDAEAQIFIQEKCSVLRLNKFNRFLVKLFLKR